MAFLNAECLFKNPKTKTNVTCVQGNLSTTRALVPPQLYASWGGALLQQYSASKDAADYTHAREAMIMYVRAEGVNSAWHVPAFGQGHVMLTVVNALWPEEKGQIADRDFLLSAIQCYTQSIRLKRDVADAYRERADALRRLPKSLPGVALPNAIPIPDPVNPPGFRPPGFYSGFDLANDKAIDLINDQAYSSANQAVVIGSNRDPKSLESIALVERSIAVRANSLGVPELPFAKECADRKARVRQAQEMMQQSEDAASAAANYTAQASEVQRFSKLMFESNKSATEYLDWLVGITPSAENKEAARDIRVEGNALNLQARQQQNESIEVQKRAEPTLERLTSQLEKQQQVVAMDATKVQALTGLRVAFGQHVPSPEAAKQLMALQKSTKEEARWQAELSQATQAVANAVSVRQMKSQESRAKALRLEGVAAQIEKEPAIPPPPPPPYTPLFRSAK